MGSWDTSSKWQPTALGELISLRKGVSYKGEFLDKPGPRLLGLGTVVPGGGLKLDEARTYSGPIREDQRIMSGELLVALTDITQEGKVLGSPGLVPRTENGGFAVTHHVARVQIKVPTRLDTRFLYYLLRGQEFKDYVRGVSMGTTVRAVSIDDVEAFEAAIPPLPEQRAISRVLGSLDDKIELNRRMNQTLEEICRALFKFWFADFGPVRAKQEGRWKKGESLPGMPADMWDLWPSEFEESEVGEIPKGWGVHGLLEIATLLSGGTPSTSEPSYWNGGIPWVSGKDVSSAKGSFLLRTERTVSEEGIAHSHTNLLPARTVVITARGTVGALAVLAEPMCISQTNYGLKVDDGIPDNFLRFAVEGAVEGLQQESYGTIFDTITTKNLSATQVVLPSAPILSAFANRTESLTDGALTNLRAVGTLAAVRDTLLPKLFSGEIRLKVDA